MATYKVVITDTTFPTVTMSYYVTAASQAIAQAFFDGQYVDSPTITALVGPTDISSGVPRLILDNEVLTIPTNIQIPHSNSIVIEAGGTILTEGTGSLTWVN